MSKLMRFLVDVALLAIISVAGYFAYTHHNQILDWYYLRNYQPPAGVAALAGQATMTDEGRRLFYRAHPQVDPDRAALVQDCHIQSDQTVELGCYLSNDKIYLLDIGDPDLSDQMVVTAAHETLHAAYDRLGKSERAHMDSLLEQAASGIRDQDLSDRLEQYAQTEPGARDSELHSILGTEFANLPPELEQYYSRYFTNRAAIVSLSSQFKQTFDGLHDEIQQLDASIRATRGQMNAYLAAGQIRSYNALVPAINRDIEDYNAKVDRYNKYASTLMGTQQAAAQQ